MAEERVVGCRKRHLSRWSRELPRALLVAAIGPAVGCGARTGLDSGGPSPVVSFQPACPGPLWLLFNLRDDRPGSMSGIYAMRADGSEGHLLSLPHGPAFNASVSPDGSKLLYATFAPPASAGGTDSTLYLYDFNARAATSIVMTNELTYSALSPDGQTVSYVSAYSLQAIDVEGVNDRTLLAGPNDSGTGYGHPVFEPDSHTIVYGTGGIVGAIGDDGSNDTTLLQALPGSFQYPNIAFSPDYSQIAVGLFCDQTSPDALRVYPWSSLPGASCAGGQILTDVSAGSSPNEANDPSWGANGLIAYASGANVWVIPPSGGSPTNMTATLTGDAGVVTASDPVWAPGCAPIGLSQSH
jgi:WD40 repeat protein